MASANELGQEESLAKSLMGKIIFRKRNRVD